MYSGKLLLALVGAYRIHLIQGVAGYFDRLADFYLHHDFPPELTAKRPLLSPDVLIQFAREENDVTIINKLIDSLLDEFSIDASFNLPDEAKDKALNAYYFPQKDLNDLLAELKNIEYSMGNHEIRSIPSNESAHLKLSEEIRNRVSSVVITGTEQLLKDTPFEKNVFVMMKFPDKNVPSENDKLLEEIWHSIDSTLNQGYGLRALRADKKDYTLGDWLWNNVCVYMESSKYGIAVLENLSGSEFNPNVAIEFGYMKALGRAVLLLKERSFNNIRADIIGRLWKEFSATDQSTIRATISKSIHTWAIDIGLRRLTG